MFNIFTKLKQGIFYHSFFKKERANFEAGCHEQFLKEIEQRMKEGQFLHNKLAREIVEPVRQMEIETIIKTIAFYWNVPFPPSPLKELISKIEAVHAEYEQKVSKNIFYQVPGSIDQYSEDLEDDQFTTDPYEYMYDQEVVSMSAQHLDYLNSLPERVTDKYS